MRLKYLNKIVHFNFQCFGNHSNCWYSLFLFILLISCKPADPNYREKPLQNTEYTGFISRNFFQVVVEVPLTKEELTILEERKSCLVEAIRKRDTLVIPILKQVAKEGKWNKQEIKKEKEMANDIEKEKMQKLKSKKNGSNSKSKTSDEINIYDKKEVTVTSNNTLLNRGEFSWFLDSMFIYKEDYSDPEKCSFVFRNIQEGLYKKVENTKLSSVK